MTRIKTPGAVEIWRRKVEGEKNNRFFSAYDQGTQEEQRFQLMYQNLCPASPR